jgi:cytochrome c-type biogenesis protein CcmF
VNATLGYGLVLGALLCAAFGAVVGLVSGIKKDERGAPWVMRSVIGYFGCILGANLVMEHALLTHDFSVKYVSQVGSRAMPLFFTIASLWSALEGSILFWALILGIYVFAFAMIHRREHARYRSLALGTMLAVGVFFAFLIAGPANPFQSLAQVPLDGPGPNPLLQNDYLLVIHPPFLYLGYVGMVVPFGVAVAALLRGTISEAWMAPLRRWTLVAWMFLTCGIILGSWWAYSVLGWGGYWAWDPVENASFLPWLCTTAFLHSTMVHERKRMLKLWTLALALASFILTVLGTFMTRSGVFNSVHSFTQSDIGPTFLVFIAILLVVSIALLAIRGPLLVPEGQITSPLSRETSILVNNLLLVAVTFTVLIGTLFPLINEAVRGTRMSVGAPYFNKMAVPGGIAILFLMGVGPLLPWGTPDKEQLKRQLIIPSLIGLGVAGGCIAAGLRGFYPLLTFGLCGFVGTVTLRELFLPASVRIREKGEAPWTALFRSATRARRRFGGYIVHFAVVIVFAAIAASQNYTTHINTTLAVGQTAKLGSYRIKLVGFDHGRDARRSWNAANFDVTYPSGNVERVSPRLNQYNGQREPVGTPAVKTRIQEDVYLSLLSSNEGAQTASINAWVFPLVGWIWWSLPYFVIGSLIAIWPSRRRVVETSSETAAAQADLTRGAA